MAALAVVRDGPTLDERLAEAQRAEIAPRNKVAELTSALEAAIEAKDYAKADKLQAQLIPAREALALAEVEARVLRESRQALDAQLAAERRELEDRQLREKAQRAIGEAGAAAKRAQEHIEAYVARMYEHLEAAQAAFREAQAWQQEAGAEERRVWQARMEAGEIDGMPRFIPAPNQASILADTVPVIGALAKWTGPAYRTPPPVAVSTAGPAGAARPFGGGAAVQSSPWQ
jgi:hypothetical protein